MKTRKTLKYAAVVAMTPFFAQAAMTDSIQRCMDTFAAENFPGSNVSFVVNETNYDPIPLIARSGTQSVKIVATAKSDGRVLGTATCKVKEDATRDGITREGKVDVMPLGS